MPGYTYDEPVQQSTIGKAMVGYDYAKVDTITVTDSGVVYTPTMPTGSAVVNMAAGGIDKNDTFIYYNFGLGLATTMEKGVIKINNEYMRFDSNSGVGPGLNSGQLHITDRGWNATFVKNHVDGSPIDFIFEKTMHNRMIGIYQNIGAADIYINPEDWSFDTGKCLILSVGGGPFHTSKSVVNSEWIFTLTGTTSILKIYNGW